MPETDAELPDNELPDEIRAAEWQEIGEGQGSDGDEEDDDE